MGGQTFDFLAALFFMSGLVLISRVRQHMKTEDETGYRYISGGLSLLAAVSLLRIYGGLELFEGVPFLADRLFFKMIVWIAAMSGLILLLSGISTWLPLSRAQRLYNKQRLHNLELVRKVAQLVKVESRSPVILAKTLDYMVTDFDFVHGALYLYSQKNRRMYLTSTSGDVTVAHSLLELSDLEIPISLHSRADEAAIARLAVRILPAGLADPSVVQPVLCGHKLAALFLLWNETTQPVEDDVRTNLKVAAGILGMGIQLETTNLRHNYEDNLAGCQERLTEILYQHRPLAENIAAIKEHLGTVIPVDLLSITIGTADGRTQRFSVGENDTVLTEIGAGSALPVELDKATAGVPQPVVVNNIATDSKMVIDDLVRSSKMGSMAAIPLVIGDLVEGVCVVAAHETNSYKVLEVAALTTLAPLLTGLLSEERQDRIRAASLRRIKIVSEFNDLAMRSKNRTDLLNHAGTILSDEIKPSIVRISNYDTDGSFMTSQCMLQRRPDSSVTPASGHMILSLMPLHRKLKESGETIVVDNSKDPDQMSMIERSQAFLPESDGVVMVPIKERGVVTGTIGMARIRNSWQGMFTQEDVEFVTAIAGILSSSAATESSVELQTSRRMTSGMLSDNSVVSDRDLRSQLKTSLTGIIGSVELMKSTGQHDEKTMRCLDIIDRSANHMKSFCSQDAQV